MVWHVVLRGESDELEQKIPFGVDERGASVASEANSQPFKQSWGRERDKDGEGESATGASAAKGRLDSILDDMSKGKIDGFQDV